MCEFDSDSTRVLNLDCALFSVQAFSEKMNPASITSFVSCIFLTTLPLPCPANHLSPSLANSKAVDLELVLPQARGIVWACSWLPVLHSMF